MKKNRKRDDFLEQLKRIPIVQVACEKANLSRNTIYRWRHEDKQFSTDMDTALSEGEALVNDMTESQLLSLIKERDWHAISFWLRHRSPKFSDKVEITGKIDMQEQPLTLEEEKVVENAIKRLTAINNK